MKDVLIQGFVNVTQMARLIDVHPATVRRWMDEGKIEFTPVSYKKNLIPVKEVLRLQEERGITFVLNTDGSVEYRHLHPKQQVDFIAEKVRFLQMLTEKKRLEEELQQRKEAVTLAEQALRRLKVFEEEQKYVFRWPNKYLNYVVNDAPELDKLKEYQELEACGLLNSVKNNPSKPL